MAEQNYQRVDSRSVDANNIARYARIAGLLYLVIIVIGLVGETVIRNSLVVSGDAAATAQRILASQMLWRVGVAAQLVLLLCAVPLSVIWYVLLRPVHKHLALLFLCFGLVSLAVESVSALYLQATLAPLSAAEHLKVVDLPQLYTLVYLSVVSHTYAFAVALIFFGVECLIVGHLMIKSGFFPKALGVMMQIAGLCYLVYCFSLILSPALSSFLFPVILLPTLIGESAFCLWLLVKGVDVAAWERKSALSR
ncbi:MAG: DUF4386 domain-containing protein [Pseudomonadota bacterium]